MVSSRASCPHFSRFSPARSSSSLLGECPAPKAQPKCQGQRCAVPVAPFGFIRLGARSLRCRLRYSLTGLATCSLRCSPPPRPRAPIRRLSADPPKQDTIWRMKADLILARGTIRTLGRSGLNAFSHLAVAGGKVQAVGGVELMGLKGPRTRVVDLHGGAVLPGFNDAHAHVVYYGLTRFGADLGGVRSVDEIVKRLRQHGRGLKKGEWQQGMGYRVDELAELRPPHRTELDEATGDRPCYIDERGGHSRVANTAALEVAGLLAAGQDPPGGRIGRDRNGLPNGLLLESAMRLVADVQPSPAMQR